MRVPVPSEKKLLTYDEAARASEKWRRRGETVAVTSGCYDLLHCDHVAFLEQAARLADRLIVSVGTSAQVRALKGPGRPVLDALERALALAGLGCVDAVVVSDEPMVMPEKDTVSVLARAIGAALVVLEAGEPTLALRRARFRWLGIRTRTVRSLKRISTTEIVGRIRGGRSPCRSRS